MDEVNLGWPLFLKNKESRTLIYFVYTGKDRLKTQWEVGSYLEKEKDFRKKQMFYCIPVTFWGILLANGILLW